MLKFFFSVIKNHQTKKKRFPTMQWHTIQHHLYAKNSMTILTVNHAHVWKCHNRPILNLVGGLAK